MDSLHGTSVRQKRSMVTPVFATLISDEYLACLNLSGVCLGHAPRHDESRA